MNPSQAMGTFLRTWRSEWAGLSRAQLAIAVSAHLPKRKSLTTKIIRKWEEGQPPNSTEELEGLCKVMRRNGLTRPEGEQFRQVVFQACVDRYYPELFPDEDFAYDAGVDEKAYAAYASTGDPERPANAVNLVTCLKAVEAVIRDRPPREASQPQGRRQDVALAVLQSALARHHWLTTRVAPRLALLEASSAFVADRFGGRLSPEVNCSGNYFEAMSQRAWAYSTEAMLPELLAYHRRMEEQGETLWAAIVFSTVLGVAAFVTDAEPRATLRSRCPDHLAVLQTLGGVPVWADQAHLVYVQCALADGALEEAERHLLHIEHWADGPTSSRKDWHDVAGRLMLQQGKPQEALDHYAQALALAERLGHSSREDYYRQEMRKCEEAQEAAWRRRSRSGSGGKASP